MLKALTAEQKARTGIKGLMATITWNGALVSFREISCEYRNMSLLRTLRWTVLLLMGYTAYRNASSQSTYIVQNVNRLT